MYFAICLLQHTVADKPKPRPSADQTRAAFLMADPVSKVRQWAAAAAVLALHGLWLQIPDSPQAPVPSNATPTINVSWIAAAQPAETPAPASQPSKNQAAKPDSKPARKVITKPAKPQTLSVNAGREPADLALPVAEPETNEPSAASIDSGASAPAAAISEPAPVTTLPGLNADYLNNPAPVYPDSARRQGEQGRVLLRVLVDAAGSVQQTVLRKSSGFAALDQAALDAVKNWRFVPARRGVEAVAAWVVVPISFSLEG